MERTESKVVQVAPNYENNKINELQVFGWNVQGRQEIHEPGISVATDGFGDETGLKLTVDKYVKLHLVRSLDLPHIDRIRELEAQYDAMPRPEYPALLPGPPFLLIFWISVWITIYLPFVYFRKKSLANKQLQELRETYEEVSQEIAALPV